eukprot:3858312-Prymnesium_polylepis.1
MDVSASKPHDMSCGKWISAGGNSLLFSSVTHRSMIDHDYWMHILQRAEDTSTLSSRTANTPMA